MRFFIAGIMQGSLVDAELHTQNYRSEIAAILRTCFIDADIYDPMTNHSDSLHYDDEKAKSTFLGHNKICGEVDAVIAFAPEASMGTAIEMWEAYRNGKVVITISPMIHNWVVKYISDAVYEDLGAFRTAAATGDLQKLFP